MATTGNRVCRPHMLELMLCIVDKVIDQWQTKDLHLHEVTYFEQFFNRNVFFLLIDLNCRCLQVQRTFSFIFKESIYGIPLPFTFNTNFMFHRVVATLFT